MILIFNPNVYFNWARTFRFAKHAALPANSDLSKQLYVRIGRFYYYTAKIRILQVPAQKCYNYPIDNSHFLWYNNHESDKGYHFHFWR